MILSKPFISRLLLGFFCLLLSLNTFAAPGQFAGQPKPDQVDYEVTSAPQTNIEMADTLRQDGKIYVVVAVFLVIMAGAIFYLIRIDRKVAKLENELGK